MTADVIPVHQSIGEAAAAVLEAADVVKVLGAGAGEVRALKGVSLSLAPGELTLLMGPSGSGKTTLLSVLGCMLSPTSGTVRIRGHATTGLGPEQLAANRIEYIENLLARPLNGPCQDIAVIIQRFTLSG